MIRHTSFKHGWFYHYRVHVPKAASLCDGQFAALNAYLDAMHTSCPDEKFTSGPRSSALRFPVTADITEIPGHEVCSYARAGLEWAQYKTAHSNVQLFMLHNDDKTLGVEVPLWGDSHELDVDFDALFKDDGPLSGHIDVLQVDDDKIWI